MSRENRDITSEEEEDKGEREKEIHFKKEISDYERETDHQSEGMIPKTSEFHWTVPPNPYSHYC